MASTKNLIRHMTKLTQRMAFVVAIAGLTAFWLTSNSLAEDEPVTRGRGQLPGAFDPTEASFELPADGPILRYRRILGELDEADRGPSIEIHADGRIMVRRPAYMLHSGTWEGRMEMNELSGLFDRLVSSGLVETDRAELMERRRALVQERVAVAEKAGEPLRVFAVGDPDVSELEIVLALYKRKGELGGAAAPLRRSWAWSDLHGDAERFPEMRELTAFDRVEHALIEWLDRDDLRKVEEEVSR